MVKSGNRGYKKGVCFTAYKWTKKTADISQRYRWFPGQITIEERGQKFHTDEVSLGSASDWLKQIPHAARAIGSSSQLWVVIRHQTSFHVEISGGVAKCWLLSQAI